MAQQGGTSYLAQKPIFCGPHVEKGTLSAEEFLDRMNTMKEASNWGDVRAIQEATAGLQGDAFTWYYRYELKLKTATHAHNMRNDWDEFKKAFKAAYFAQRSAADADLDWVGARQQGGQSVVQFMHNTAAAINENFELAKAQVKETRPTVDATPTAYIAQARRAWLQALQAADQAHVVQIARGYANQSLDLLSTELTKLTTCKVAGKGAKQEKVRLAIGRALRAQDELDGIIDKARAEEAMSAATGPAPANPQQQQQGRGPRNPQQQRGGRQGARVAAVEEQHDNNGHFDVDAIGRQQRGGARGRGRGTGRGRGAGAAPRVIRCFLCDEEGHAVSDCLWRGRVRQMMGGAGQRPNANPQRQQQQVAALEDEAEEIPLEFAPAGNE